MNFHQLPRVLVLSNCLFYVLYHAFTVFSYAKLSFINLTMRVVVIRHCVVFPFQNSTWNPNFERFITIIIFDRIVQVSICSVLQYKDL